MNKNYPQDLNLGNNKLDNAVLGSSTSGEAGSMNFNSSSGNIEIHSGAEFIPVMTSNFTAGTSGIHITNTLNHPDNYGIFITSNFTSEYSGGIEIYDHNPSAFLDTYIRTADGQALYMGQTSTTNNSRAESYYSNFTIYTEAVYENEDTTIDQTTVSHSPGGYDIQFTNSFGNIQNFNMSSTGVTINGINIDPSPTSVTGTVSSGTYGIVTQEKYLTYAVLSSSSTSFAVLTTDLVIMGSIEFFYTKSTANAATLTFPSSGSNTRLTIDGVVTAGSTAVLTGSSGSEWYIDIKHFSNLKWMVKIDKIK